MSPTDKNARMKTCLFCSAHLTRHNRSKEPVIPRWLLSHLDAQDEGFVGKHWSYPNKPLIIFSEREQAFLSLVLENVCIACKQGWMAQLEKEIEPLLKGLLTGRHTVLTNKQCDILARWTFKTAAVLNYSVNYKKIIPLEHIHRFFITNKLPQNSTVDFAWCYTDRIHWFLGGNKKFAVLSKKLKDSQKKVSYVVTLQFGHVLLRLAWVPVEGVRAVIFPSNVVYRFFPQDKSELQLVRRHIFKDDEQFHFMATILAEEGVFPNNLDFPPLAEQSSTSIPRYIVWDGLTKRDYQWDRVHDCIVTYDNYLISVQKVRQSVLRKGMEPIIIFMCQRGKSAHEVNLGEEGWHGLGTYSFIKASREDPAISIRNLITRTNEIMAEMGFDQVAEVICKEDLLDHPFGDIHPSYRLFFGTFDCCRKCEESHKYFIDPDCEFSP